MGNWNELLVNLAGAPGEKAVADGTLGAFRQGKTGEMLTANTHPWYYEAALRGRLHYSYGAAVAMSASNTTALGNIIWNPPGSGVNLVLAKWSFACTVTDADAMAVLLGYSVQSTVPTGTTASVNGPCLLGPLGTPTSKAKAYTAATLSVAATAIALLCHVTAAIATTGVDQMGGDFDGSIIVPPGYLVHMMGIAAFAASGTYSTVVWEEVPIS